MGAQPISELRFASEQIHQNASVLISICTLLLDRSLDFFQGEILLYPSR